MQVEGKRPIRDSRPGDQFFETCNSDLQFKNTSETAKNFVQNLLQKYPSKRMSLHQALEHPFIKQAKKDKCINIFDGVWNE